MFDTLIDALTAFAHALGDRGAPLVDFLSSSLSSLFDSGMDSINNTDPTTWLLFCLGLLLFWQSFFRRV